MEKNTVRRSSPHVNNNNCHSQDHLLFRLYSTEDPSSVCELTAEGHNPQTRRCASSTRDYVSTPDLFVTRLLLRAKFSVKKNTTKCGVFLIGLLFSKHCCKRTYRQVVLFNNKGAFHHGVVSREGTHEFIFTCSWCRKFKSDCFTWACNI